MRWPNNKKFAFTIIDDTDDSFIYNIKPIYDLLYELNIKTTKTVWVFPSRNYYEGASLMDDEYAKYILDLQSKGFEIALHNVGSGTFYREEIKEGINLFNQILGHYPNIQINHGCNSDNLYWGAKRFTKPLSYIYSKVSKYKSYGDVEGHSQFWGDINKDKIKYLRNHCFYGINTLKYDKNMPYKVKDKPYVNYFFSASDGDTVSEFTNLLSKKNVDKLEKQGGLCIVYTHFGKGFINDNGELDKEFKENLEYLASKDAWFAPVTEILDYMLANNKNSGKIISKWRLFLLDLKWCVDRIVKKLKFKR